MYVHHLYLHGNSQMLAASSFVYGLPNPAEVAGMTGREMLQAMIDRKIPAPPIAQTLNFWIVEVGDGSCVFEGETKPDFLNPLGTIHGGWALTLIDTVTGVAGHTLLPAGVGYATVETKANFTRAIRADTGRVRAEGSVVTRSRQIISAEGRVLDSEGRVLAHGTSTLMVFGNGKNGGERPVST
jgi:uncharacterized protein (TIGR00369 family)